jgi:hypothetical protein
MLVGEVMTSLIGGNVAILESREEEKKTEVNRIRQLRIYGDGQEPTAPLVVSKHLIF